MKSPLTLLKTNSLIDRILRDFTAPVSSDLMRSFQIYFAFHIFISNFFDCDSQSFKEGYLLLGVIAMFLAAMATLSKRYCRVGLLVLLFFQVWWSIIDTFPMTANHEFLEGFILLCLILFPSRIVDRDKKLVDGSSCHLIQFAILYSYFFSGFHKILHGFWLNGELLGWSMFSFKDVSSAIYRSGQFFLKVIANLFNLPISDIPFERSLDMGQAAVSIPIWIVIMLVVMHWVTILGEFAVPILVVLYRNQKLGRYLLLGMTLMIGLPSFELRFLFVALGCDFLFFLKRPVQNYTILLLLRVLVMAMLFGLRLTGVFPL